MVIEKGRKNTLKDAKASLRDQLVAKLAKKLRDDNVGQKISKLWLAGNANRTEWLDRQAEYLASWDVHTPSTDDSAAPSSYSDLHLPTLFVVVKTLHARFLQAILGVDPPFNVKARTEAYVDRVGLISDTLNYGLKKWGNHYRGMEQELDKWVWAWVAQGSGTLKQGWDVEYTRFVDVQKVSKPDVPEFIIDAEGNEQVIPKSKMVEEEVTVTKKCFDGPVGRFISVEDLLIVGGQGDPDRADVVIERDYLDSSKLWTLADRGVFDADVVEKIIQSGPDNEVAEDQSGMKQDRAKESGNSNPDNDNDHDRYQILEAYMRYDADGSGIFTDVVVWVHPRTAEILRATYLRRVNKSGERPYRKIDFYLRNDQEYGVGIVEVLYPIAKEMDAMHNMRIDFGLMSTMPFGFYRPSSSIEPEVINYEPGTLIPVDNPQTDVFFPNLGNRTSFGMQEEQALQQMVDRVTSISDMNLGLVSGQQGATRTATGARLVAGEASANLDVFLRRLNRGWRRFLEYMLHQLQQRIPAGLSFRVTGEAGDDYWRTVRDAENIEGDYDIEISENSSSSNKQIQQDVAQQIMQITSNPLDVQLQLVNANNRYAALKNYLQALGIKEWGRYVSKPQGYRVPLTPEEEANRLLRGIPVPVSPEMDHEGFLAFFEMIVNNDELLDQFNERETLLLAAQAKQHEAMASAVAAAQAQAANAAQMRNNSQLSQQQAPVAGTPTAPQGAQAPSGQAPQ